MTHQPGIRWYFVLLTILSLCPTLAAATAPYAIDPTADGRTWVDFNEDGHLDYVITDPATGRLNWFVAHGGRWHEISESEVVAPWKGGSSDQGLLFLRRIQAEEGIPHLFGATFDGRLCVIDTETGYAVRMGSLASIHPRLSPNAMTTHADSALTVFARQYTDGHLYDFRPVSGALVTDHRITLPLLLNARGLAARDEDTIFAAYYNPGGSGSNVSGYELWLFRIESKSVARIGSMGSWPRRTQSLAYSQTGVLFGWSLTSQLMRIDTATGSAEMVGEEMEPYANIQALAFGPDGTLYGGRDQLYRIDTATGQADLIGPMRLDRDGGRYGVDIRGLAFTQADVREVGFGLRAGHCPVRFMEMSSGRVRGFITGSEDLDVSGIDESSVLILGSLPVDDVRIMDIATLPGNPGDCPRPGADGFDDLVFFFDSGSAFDLLWMPGIGDAFRVDVSAMTRDGVFLFGSVPATSRLSHSWDKSVPNPLPARGLRASPNPFNPRTTFTFRLESPGRASLHIYDHRGRLVRTLVQDHFPAGEHRETWDGRDDRGSEVASGSYRALLRTEDGRRSIAVLLLR